MPSADSRSPLRWWVVGLVRGQSHVVVILTFVYSGRNCQQITNLGPAKQRPGVRSNLATSTTPSPLSPAGRLPTSCRARCRNTNNRSAPGRISERHLRIYCRTRAYHADENPIQARRLILVREPAQTSKPQLGTTCACSERRTRWGAEAV